MDLAVAFLALVISVVALSAAIRFGRQLQGLHARVDGLRRELDQTQGELNELKAAAEVVPGPPLPRARTARLDDLRQQLRASHAEEEEKPEA